MITLLHEQRETHWPDEAAEGEALWLAADAIEKATGWVWKAEGLCHGDTCVPLPSHAAGAWVREGAGGRRLDLAAMWRHAGQPVVHDDAARTWVLGTGSAQRAAALASLQAPDFALPDLEGREHRLSALRGKKVFLATWASW